MNVKTNGVLMKSFMSYRIALIAAIKQNYTNTIFLELYCFLKDTMI